MPRRSLHHRSLLPILGPLLVALVIGVLVWHSRQTGVPQGTEREIESPSSRVRASKVAIDSLAIGDTVPDWIVSQGSFRLVSQGDRTVLELGFEPLVEGRLVWNRLLKKGGMVRVRMWGERTRRNAPRFALGITGTSVYWLRTVPLLGQIQIVGKEETILASEPWTGDANQPFWMELALIPSPTDSGKGTMLEGRIWPDSKQRPELPSIHLLINEEVGLARVNVAGAAYALKPIYIDFIEASLN